MNSNTILSLIWAGAAALFAGLQYPMSDLNSVLLAGATGAIMSLYMALYVFRSTGKTYLLRVLPLLAVVCACLYFHLTGQTFYGLDQMFKGFQGFGAGLFVMAAASRLFASK